MRTGKPCAPAGTGLARSPVSTPRAYATRIGGEVKNFDPLQFVAKKDVKKLDGFIQLAIAASQFAMDDAKLQVTADNADQTGVFIASGIGGFHTIQDEHKELLNGGPRRVSPFFIPASIINLATGHVSIRFGAKGPNLASCTACAASAHSIGESVEIIRRGDADDDDCRRLGDGADASERRGVRLDARAFDPQ